MIIGPMKLRDHFTCQKCGARDVQTVDIGTGYYCVVCVDAALLAPPPADVRAAWVQYDAAVGDAHRAGVKSRRARGAEYLTDAEQADFDRDVAAARAALVAAVLLPTPAPAPAAPPAPPPADPCAGIAAPAGSMLVQVRDEHGTLYAHCRPVCEWPACADFRGFAYPPRPAHPHGYVCGVAILYRSGHGYYRVEATVGTIAVHPVAVAVAT